MTVAPGWASDGGSVAAGSRGPTACTSVGKRGGLRGCSSSTVGLFQALETSAPPSDEHPDRRADVSSLALWLVGSGGGWLGPGVGRKSGSETDSLIGGLVLSLPGLCWHGVGGSKVGKKALYDAD